MADTGYRIQYSVYRLLDSKDTNARIQGYIGYRIQDAPNSSQPGGPLFEGPADSIDIP